MIIAVYLEQAKQTLNISFTVYVSECMIVCTQQKVVFKEDYPFSKIFKIGIWGKEKQLHAIRENAL